jgi:hypothetical protein
MEKPTLEEVSNMPFEIFARKTMRRGVPSVTATKLGRIAINKSATEHFEKNAVEFVLLLWDGAASRFAIRPILKKDSRSYRVTYGEKGNGAGFSAKTFLDHIGLDYSSSRSMSAMWNKESDQLEVQVPPEFLKAASEQQNLIEMEPAPIRKASQAK